jgi:biopolymer transport protein TolR
MGLVPRLQQIRAEEGDSVIYVRGDRSVAYGDVMAILGLVGQSGYARVSLLSQHAPSNTTP